MARRVFLAFLVFGLVACGDDSTGLEDILGTYTLQTINEEELGFSFQTVNPDGTILITVINAAEAVFNPQSCAVITNATTTLIDPFGQVRGESSMAVTTQCTFMFRSGALTLNYTDGTVDTGSIVGSTLTITRNGALWVFRK